MHSSPGDQVEHRMAEAWIDLPFWNRIFDVMNKKKLDALIASTPENVSYLCDIPRVPGVVSESDVHGVVFRDKGSEPAAIMPAVAVDQWAQSTSPIKDVKIYGEFYYYKTEPLNYKSLSEAERKVVDIYFGHPRAREILDAVVNVFRERGIVKGRVGFDEVNMPTTRIRGIQKKLPRIKFTPAHGVFQEIRMVKSTDEIEKIRRAVEVTEKGIQAVLDAAKLGVPNSDLVLTYETTVKKHGCKPHFASIGAGSEGALVNHLPSPYMLKKGDTIRIDCNAVYSNYLSDVGRNAVVEVVSDKARKYCEALIDGVNAMEAVTQPGIKLAEVFREGVSTVRRSGIHHYERQNVGHSLGLQVVEPPVIMRDSNIEVQEDMVIAIETPYYELGFGSFNPEDTVRITKHGIEKLSKMENRLYVV